MEWVNVLQSLGLHWNTMKYTTASVAVYTGEYQQYPVVFKILRLLNQVSYQEVEKECQQMLAAQDENVVKLYDYQWTQTGAGIYLVMVLEACDKDLARDIRDRAKNRYMYTEQELWNFVFSLIHTFATMQRKGLVHRDIKPENIFLSRGVVKVGDFLSGRNSIADQMTATLIGTPIYLSPILRQGFFVNQHQATHNAFKSDVYSLGLTLLALARLQPPIFTVNGGDSQVQSVTWALQYSEFLKRFLSWMLTWEESNRPDFVQIDEWITATYHSQPAAPHPSDSPYQQQSPTHSHYSREFMLAYEQSQKLQCLYCHGTIMPNKYIVSLKCNPDFHVFCSVECFSKEVQRQQGPRCPVCEAPIDQEDLDFYCVSAEPPGFIAQAWRFFSYMMVCNRIEQ